MANKSFARREVLRAGVAAGAVAALPATAHAAKLRYDPKANFELTVSEVEYRRNAKGRALMARIYQPVGPGPFPVILDFHGGAWNAKNRTAEQPFDRAMASAGALVVAVDLTLAGEAPYPACVQDGSYAVRWLRKNASKWKGDVSRLGLFGSSSGGHVAELLTLRPNDARYHAIPLAGGAGIKATFDYVILRSPISDTFARYDNAKQMNNASMMKNNENFFVPFETIHEGNPKEILDRAEKVAFKPMIVMQGALDTNVRPEAQAAFVDAYRNAGGQIEYVVFEGCEHEWVAEPSPQTDHAHERAKEYIAWHVAH